jgi:hypothetical protein
MTYTQDAQNNAKLDKCENIDTDTPRYHPVGRRKKVRFAVVHDSFYSESTESEDQTCFMCFPLKLGMKFLALISYVIFFDFLIFGIFLKHLS